MTNSNGSSSPLAIRLGQMHGASELSWDRERNGPSSSEGSWIHVSTIDESHRRWVETELRDAPDLCQALLAEETRPRCLSVERGLLVKLREVNLNQGAQAEDMVSLPIISSSRRHVFAVDGLRDACEQERGRCHPARHSSGSCHI
ncbi:MAG: CorA family divalent cation transporter [Planctomycetota bacterium]